MKDLSGFLRKENGRQAMRHSAALTTVYLLEMNRKFEAFMREKVEALEGRVSAQQARFSFGEAGDERGPSAVETWVDQVEDRIPPEPTPNLGETEATRRADAGAQPDDSPPVEPPSAPVEAVLPDYKTLLLGNPADIMSADSVAEESTVDDEGVPATIEAEAAGPGPRPLPDTVPIKPQMSATGTEDHPEQSGLAAFEDDPEPVAELTSKLTDVKALEFEPGIEPVNIVDPIGPAGAQGDDERWPGEATWVLLTGDEPSDEAGIPAIELLTAETETLLDWSPEAEASVAESEAFTIPPGEKTGGDEAGLDLANAKDIVDERAGETTLSDAVDDPDTDPDAWDLTLPAAGQKGAWA